MKNKPYCKLPLGLTPTPVRPATLPVSALVAALTVGAAFGLGVMLIIVAAT